MKFRTRPFQMTAVQFNGRNFEELLDFTEGKFYAVEPEDRTDDPEITAEVFDVLHSTWVGVKDYQWIIKGSKGEFYPCDPEVFETKYEAIDE